MGGITINLNIEDVSATRHLVIGCLDLSLMARTTFVIYGHVVRIGIVVTVRHTRNHAKLLAVLLRKLTRKALSRCCQNRVIMVVALTELISSFTHIAYYLQSQFLSLSTLAVMLADKCHQTLCQSNKSNAQCALVDDTLDGVHWAQFVSANP